MIILNEFWENPLGVHLEQELVSDLTESSERTLFVGKDNPIRITTGHRLLQHDGNVAVRTDTTMKSRLR